MQIQTELIMLGLSILFFLSIFVGNTGSKFGIPALLLFLSVGMICGSDGLGIQFENIQVAQTIGTISLCIILFSGGLDTKISEIRPIMFQGVILATFGVFITAFLTGFLIWIVLDSLFPEAAGIGFLTPLLLAAIMSSTDSASVFSILRSKGMHLKNNLRPLLELESGSNDPMAYILVITLISIINSTSEVNYWQAGFSLIIQLGIGAITGYVLGKIAVYILKKIRIANTSLYPIMVLTFCIFIFSTTYYLSGNGYLAIYISGLVIGNSKFIQKRSALKFFDGLAWISQLLMFLTLGLLVNPHELVPLVIPCLLISFLMIFITRPATVFFCLLPFTKMGSRDKLFVSWVGLRGAVPIIFAILPLAADVPHARLIFNIVFFCTLVSLLVQGSTLPLVAKWLGLAEKPREIKQLEDFDVDISNDINSIATEIDITAQSLTAGNKLMNLALPDKTLAIMVKRGEKFFVPNGKTELKEHDKLMIVTDNYDAFIERYNDLNTSPQKN